MDKIFIPAKSPEEWKSFWADSDSHWAKGHSAKALAYCWQEANDFPRFEDYNQFLALYGLSGEKDLLIGPVNINGIDLYFGWVKGEPEYLKK